MKLFNYRNSLIIILINLSFLFFANLDADTVRLKSGKIYTNVKTEIGETFTTIIDENRKEKISNSEIIELKPEKVNWKKKIEEVKKPEETKKTEEVKKNDEEKKPDVAKKTEEESNVSRNQTEIKKNEPSVESKKYPLNNNYLYSLIPGWSAMNTTEYWYLGISLSVLEYFALQRARGKIETRALLDNDDFRNLLILGYSQDQTFTRRELLRDVLVLNYFRNHTLQGERAINENNIDEHRRVGFNFLILWTLLDVGLSKTLLQNEENLEKPRIGVSFQGKENFQFYFETRF
ncbi:MAG: hypothetical protein SFU98_14900 [Leptospiraceae bacterium]|nr:hypothetical protein [Leptospiraceae bacterium]